MLLSFSGGTPASLSSSGDRDSTELKAHLYPIGYNILYGIYDLYPPPAPDTSLDLCPHT